MAANDNLDRLRQWVDSLNRGRPTFAETFAPEATIELVGGSPDVRDRDSFAKAMTALLGAFPGLQFTVDELLSAGDSGDATVIRWTARGTHRGDQLGVPATGKSVTFQGIIVDRWGDGKIVERHEVADALGLMQQLGVVPTPGQST